MHLCWNFSTRNNSSNSSSCVFVLFNSSSSPSPSRGRFSTRGSSTIRMFSEKGDFNLRFWRAPNVPKMHPTCANCISFCSEISCGYIAFWCTFWQHVAALGERMHCCDSRVVTLICLEFADRFMQHLVSRYHWTASMATKGATYRCDHTILDTSEELDKMMLTTFSYRRKMVDNVI